MKPKLLLAIAAVLSGFTPAARPAEARPPANSRQAELAREIRADRTLAEVHRMAQDLLRRGLNAGSGYSEVWIRDLNTFIEVALEVNPPERLRDALLTFFKFQGPGGDIVDGYVPLDQAKVKYAYRTSMLAPNLMAHKNTVETDQESSLVQAVRKYVRVTGDTAFLDERVNGVSVRERLARALQYVLTDRFDREHGLVWGATTADWGDVQPESPWGVELDSQSHRTLDIYDNAMLILAINDYLDLLGVGSPEAPKWRQPRDELKRNVRAHLWDAKRQKFIPHVYLAGSPFPKDFDESAIFYFGGTAAAIQAGLLSREEVLHSLAQMVANVRSAGAASIGLTLYPPYPEGFFKNPQMRSPYSYQNGGDWCWFGGRMIQALIQDGYIAEAYRELRPMVERVKRTGGFHEWWSRDNQPRGSGEFRGSAGVLGRAIELLQAWASSDDVTLESLLNEMTDFAAVARWPEPEFTCKQASSYDRAKVAPDKPGWFANRDQNQFIRTETNQGRTEKVMLDADGPGCIVRFWLTGDKTKNGTLRIYLDGAVEAALVFPAYDLLSGNLNVGAPLAQPHPGYRPDGNGGNTLYLPIPYAKHCKVTWEEAGSGARYYQINYRTYAPGTKVETFTRAALEAARPAVERVNRNLLSPPAETDGQTIALAKKVAANGGASLEFPSGPAAVRRLELRVPAGLAAPSERALRKLIFQMECDGERTGWCPVSDFFGSGVGLNPVESWYRAVETNGTMICRWVMPYQRTAKITLLNLAGQTIQASLRASVSPWSWGDRSMHFYAVWHYESGLRTPPPRDWNFVNVTGRGVYVGDTLALFNPIATWFGEGDEKIWVDGESFPSHLGTGTEDYYGYSYAPMPVHQTPFCGESRIDQAMTQGHNTNIRTRNLDGIPFRRSLQFDMELISWKPTTLTYAATTYWYALPGAESNVQPQPREAALPVPTLAEASAASAPPRRPGAIECETMGVVAKSGDFFVGKQDMDPFGGERWSNGRQLLGKTTAIGDWVEIELAAPDVAPRTLVLYATQAPDYATLRFRVNGQPVAATFDGYGNSVRPAPAFPLGVFAPHDGEFTLRIEVSGANPAASGAKYFWGLDCVTLEQP